MKNMTEHRAVGVQDRTFLVWNCKDSTCSAINCRATKAFQEGGTRWYDIQARCPKCMRKKRLYAKNTKSFESREAANELIEEYLN